MICIDDKVLSKLITAYYNKKEKAGVFKWIIISSIG